MGKLKYNEEDYQNAAITAEKELLKIPVITLRQASKHMTIRRGVRGTVLVGSEDVSGAEIAPYSPNRKSDVDLNLNLRPLTTYFGSVNAEFEPNTAMNTLLDHQACKAMDGEQVSTPTAKDVLALIAKGALKNAPFAIWKGVRNPKGTTTLDLCDGFDTITAKDVDSGELSEAKGNYIELDEVITRDNAYDVITGLVEKLDDIIREQKCYLYCSRQISDWYNRSYKANSKGIGYADKYEQTVVEGSNGNLIICPQVGKRDSDYIHIAPESNMLIGVDQESDQENVRVKDYNPDTLTFMMRMFLGCQVRCVDKTQYFVAKLKKADGAAGTNLDYLEAPEVEGDNQEDNQEEGN